jgi:two-component system, sporulation sensor kinase E
MTTPGKSQSVKSIAEIQLTTCLPPQNFKMNSSTSKPATSKPDQPRIVLIHAVLAIGFVFLLTLIWLIGSRSVDELERISSTELETSKDLKERLVLASQIRVDEINVVAQARLVRVARQLSISIIPLRTSLGDARQQFNKTFEEARKRWGKRVEQRNLGAEEMNAWREVELAAPEFLATVEKLALAKDEESLAEKTEQPEQLKPSEPIVGRMKGNTDQAAEVFLQKAGEKFDEAAVKLRNAILTVEEEKREQLFTRQRLAAESVSRTRWAAVSMGLFIAGTVFLILRSRIAALRKAVRQAQESKDFARSIFDSQSNDILVIAENGDLLTVNQAFYKHFNLQPSELTLQDYRGAFAHLPEVAGFVQQTLKLPDKDGSHRERIEVKPKRGLRQSQNFPTDSKLLDVYISPLTIDFKTQGRVVVLLDVTEAERAREELRRSRALSTVGQITAQVAHELYNPIGAVKLNIELLEMQMTGADEDLKHTVARLKRGAEHLSTIVMDLRYLTRARDPERKPTNLNSLLEEVVELASDRLERSRTVIVRHFSKNLPQGNCDPQQLRKVFLNLLINAIEASPVSSEVELHTNFVAPDASAINDLDTQHGALAVSVLDHGSGMSEETMRRLFEAFYTTKRNGTGLGMMITQEIVKKHGGKIEVESEEGKGTRVSVYLPV